MNSALLLDTCAVIWIANGDFIAAEARKAMNLAASENQSVQISPISAWEIGLLVARGRLSIAGRPQNWYAQVIGTPGVVAARMPEELLIESSFLPGNPPSDPADRIIIATAREFGLRIVTRDRRILNYANEGHTQALEC